MLWVHTIHILFFRGLAYTICAKIMAGCNNSARYGTVMISVVLYGRNDNYGYNLHKRAALSFNCIAEVLNDAHDEILFVDYNTPDDYPTFPEAIQDTLTDKARKILRIFRVRPSIHERFKLKSRLLALEPVARNIAVRRSHPANRWILSTNTDMIFVPQRRQTLNDIVEDLPDRLYHAPRMEIPETLWESLDRRDARGAIETVRGWGRTLYIDEIVLGSDIVRYDGPGDFQLIARTDLFKYHGFDERMLLGWHVDSNIAKRWSLVYGKVGDLGSEIYGYHCDHTRQITPAHSSHTRTENDWRRFINTVDRPDIPEQADDWGCAHDEIEEVRIDQNMVTVYIEGLREVIGAPLETPCFASYTSATYDKVDYDPRHVLPFLADMFVSSRRNINIAWFGGKLETLQLFSSLWQKLGFVGEIFIDENALSADDIAGLEVRRIAVPQLYADANAFIFDFGPLSDKHTSWPASKRSRISGDMRLGFLHVVRCERIASAKGRPLRRIIALGVVNTELERFVVSRIAAGLTPYSTRLRHGFVLSAPGAKIDWLAHMAVGRAGHRGPQADLKAPVIQSVAGAVGCIAYGPVGGRDLPEGRYRLSLSLDAASSKDDARSMEPCIVIDILSGWILMGSHIVQRKDLGQSSLELLFTVPYEVTDSFGGVQVFVRLLRPLPIAISALSIEGLDVDQAGGSVPAVSKIFEWLPYVHLNVTTPVDEDGYRIGIGTVGPVIYGPYWPLPSGRYELIVTLERLSWHREAVFWALERLSWHRETVFWALVDVYAADRILGKHEFRTSGWWWPIVKTNVPFEVTADLANRPIIETRIWSTGAAAFRIRSVAVRTI